MPRARPLRPRHRPLLAIYTINMAVKYNAVSLRHKHSPETLIIHINQYINIVLAFTDSARQSILHLKFFFFSFNKNFIFLKILFIFFFRKFCPILFDFILF